MNRLRALLIVPMLLLCAAPGAHGDTIVYNQPSNFPFNPPPGGFSLYASQTDSPPPVGEGDGNFATAYDNFTLGTNTSILDVTWQGGYFGDQLQVQPPTVVKNNAPYPQDGGITSFTLTFWTNVAGQPGSPIMTYTIPFGQTNETFVGTEGTQVPPGGPFTKGIYNYSTDLSSPFDASGGTTYWLSIVANLPLYNTPGDDELQWGWHTGTGGDGVSFQDFGGERFLDTTDLAFSLSANVPEPASLMVWGVVGVASLGYRRWRGRKRAA